MSLVGLWSVEQHPVWRVSDARPSRQDGTAGNKVAVAKFHGCIVSMWALRIETLVVLYYCP